MVTVVVTGASGFLGGAVVRALSARAGVRVEPVSRRSVPGAVRVAAYTEAPRGDVLVHLAEQADRAKACALGDRYEAETATTLAALLDGRYGRAIYASSAVLYGDASTEPHTADDPVCVNDSYTRSKRRGELAALASPGGIAVRVANVYGPGMSAANVMSRILGQIPGSGPVEVMDTTPVRDFVWIEDAAEAFAALAARDGDGGVFNVGMGMGTSIGAVARLALALSGEGDRPIATTGTPRPSTLIVDGSRTTERCGWRPRTTLADGLALLLSRTEAKHT